jgi:hypothetical protein
MLRISVFLYRDPGLGKIRIRDEIPKSFSESLETVFGLKIHKFFYADPDPGSGDPESF